MKFQNLKAINIASMNAIMNIKKNISRRALCTVFEIKIILNDYQIIFERVIQLKTCLFTK